jgi:AcrR family transcriptional regulator
MATRSDRRREQTRSKLTAAAGELIAARGIAGLKIGDITDLADVGRGSFYNHFPSKEALVEAVVSESLQTIAARVLRDLPDDSATAVATADRRFIRLATEDPDLARLMVNLDRSDGVFAAAVTPYAREAIAGRLDIPDLELALIMLTSSALGVIRSIIAGDAPADADCLHAEYVLRMFGVDPKQARKLSRQRL